MKSVDFATRQTISSLAGQCNHRTLEAIVVWSDLIHASGTLIITFVQGEALAGCNGSKLCIIHSIGKIGKCCRGKTKTVEN